MLARLLGAVIFCMSPLVQAIVVSPNGTLTDLGFYTAGTYHLTGSGLVDLCGPGATFTLRPDGVPDGTVTCGSYGATFNPSGSLSADGLFGPAGTNAKIGALIGTLNALADLGSNPTPAEQADWFLIGYATTITLATDGHIYASVNDTFFPNNVGSFDVTVRAASGVPEPGTLALLAAAGLIALRTRRSAGADART